jgi:cysteine-rich repeat protein
MLDTSQRRTSMQRSFFLYVVLVGLVTACGPYKSSNGDASVSGDASGLDGSVDSDAADYPDTTVPDAYVPGCGNGVLDDGEACDDGNQMSGDGCNASCTQEDGFDMVAAAFTDGDQLVPRITVAGTAILMAWEDWGVIDPDGAGARVRSFTEDGVPRTLPAIGAALDFPANTTSTADQFGVAVAGHADGRFVVAWTDTSDAAGGGIDVRAMMFDADGNRLPNPQSGTSDFVVHTTTTGTQQQPAVGVSDQGLILIAWSDDSATGGDTTGWAVRGRLFDFSGTPQVNLETGGTDDFLINTNPGGSQYRPSLVANGSVGWGLVWLDDTNLDGSGAGSVGTRLGAYGDHVPGDVLINTTTTGAQIDPVIALQPTVGFVVAWTDDSRGADDPYFRAIRARVLDLSYTPRPNGVTMTTDDFPVNTLIEGSQQWPGVAVDPTSGNVIIVWQDGSASDGSWAGIRGRAFNPGLSPLSNDLATDGADFPINTITAEAQLTPSVVVAGGQAVCIWEDQSGALPDVSGTAVRYRLLPPLW